MSGESAEPLPQKHRNKPGSHADLGGCGGETDWDISKVDYESEGEPVVGVTLWLLPPQTADGRCQPKKILQVFVLSVFMDKRC